MRRYFTTTPIKNMSKRVRRMKPEVCMQESQVLTSKQIQYKVEGEVQGVNYR